MKETNWETRLNRLLPVIIFALAGCLLIGGICLLLIQTHPPVSSIPRPMPPEPQASDTAAMLDPNREVRGIWIPSVQNITYPSEPGLSETQLKQELAAIVRTARESNLNTICFQVRPSSDALYTSRLFPTSAYLSGTQGKEADGGFDPLAYLCSLASEEGMTPLAVYAWVNPLRVTAAETDLSALSPENPAAQHPEWTVSYGGALYYNAGIPEVRQLVSDGVAEICENYPVAGIIFDDYFYPYPKAGENGTLLPFDDQKTFEQYGGAFSDIGDWRRDNVSQMIRSCYETVKGVSPYLQFGAAPFGIWDNDDGTNGGSQTGGLSSYEAIYCDTLAWIRGGCLDFVAPQIYWQFTTKAARYDTLVRWWNAQCDGTGVHLWISHAIYRYEDWNTPGEMRTQVSFARSERTYRGSLFYGYAQLAANTGGVADEIRQSMSGDILYYETAPSSMEAEPDAVAVSLPHNRTRCDSDGCYLMGYSDPRFPLTCNGRKISRTRSGYFAFYTGLQTGENQFVFLQKGKETVHFVFKNRWPPALPDEKPQDVPESGTTQAEPPQLIVKNPASLTALPAESELLLSVKASPESHVSARIGDESIELSMGEIGRDGLAVYTAKYALPKQEAGAAVSLGTVMFTAGKNGMQTDLSGGELYALGKGAVLGVTVRERRAFLKIAPDSWYYDDYIPQVTGMQTETSHIENGYARIAAAGQTAYLEASALSVTGGANRPGHAGVSYLTTDDAHTVLHIPLSGNLPVQAVKSGNSFTVTVFQAETADSEEAVFAENPMISSVTQSWDAEKHTVTISAQLKDGDRFRGFSVSYADGEARVSLRHPLKLSEVPGKPLSGMDIVLDAGHGGTEPGTDTPGSHFGMLEKNMNLEVTLRAAEKLRALGANIILLRDDDDTVDIFRRMDEIDRIQPDFLISVHQNAVDITTDITHIRGVVGLYWTESGKTLADAVAARTSEMFGFYQRETTKQRLAMLRNYGFPAALIEFCFVTCPEEFEAMTAPGGYQKAADALTAGILDWISEP